MQTRKFVSLLIALFSLQNCLSYTDTPLLFEPISKKELQTKKPVKTKWTFIVYVAADNDLDYFARRNLESMAQAGSNENVSIVVQLDRHGAHEKTKRLFVAKNTIYQVNDNDISSQQKLNSGSAQTLIDCCKWAMTDYPADHYALILWNHGIGILDSIRSKVTNASELFTFNPANHMLELDRSISFLNYLEKYSFKEDPRGVCFSDTYGSYLTNQKLDYALKVITQDILKKKIDIIGFDACLMAMVEVGNLISPYADYMVASQEVELGTGYPYKTMLQPFAENPLNPEEFAKHMVTAYEEHYVGITKDYTQSAVKLNCLNKLEKNITEVCTTILSLLEVQQNYSAKRAIRASRAKRTCTSFAEPNYIDLHHFYTNLLETTDFIQVEQGKENLKVELATKLQEGLNLFDEIIVKNGVGKNVEKAKGLSIYFPLRRIDASYLLIPFVKQTNWLDFLTFII